MLAIRESSGKIADIISVVDGIAFQTNILALSAAVEAARAGDAGQPWPMQPRSFRRFVKQAVNRAPASSLSTARSCSLTQWHWTMPRCLMRSR